MQPICSDLLAVPWAVLPDRLPFIRLVLTSVAHGQRPTRRARAGASIDTELHRRAGNNTIAVLPCYGISVQRTDAFGEALGLLSLRHFTQAFRVALADDSIEGIVIDVDSPGGSVYGVMELADEIYRSRAVKPIAAIANSLAASGAYWIASAASELYATPGGEVGGIGIYDMHTDLSKGLEKAGISTTLIAAGKYKTEGNPFQPLSTGARRHAQSRVNEYYGMFVRSVARNRRVDVATVRSGMGDGRVLGAQAARDANMVDGIATFDEVVRRLAQRIGQGRTAGVSSRAAQLQARQCLIDALNYSPSNGTSRTATSAAVRRREIELLAL